MELNLDNISAITPATGNDESRLTHNAYKRAFRKIPTELEHAESINTAKFGKERGSPSSPMARDKPLSRQMINSALEESKGRHKTINRKGNRLITESGENKLFDAMDYESHKSSIASCSYRV